MASRPALAPALACQDVDKTYEFFTAVLGFAGQGKWAGPDGSTMHAMAILPTKYGDAPLMLGPAAMAAGPDSGAFGENLRSSPHTVGNGVVLWFTVPDVDKYAAFIQARGAVLDEEPKDQFWGDRTISVRTPEGMYLTFASPIKGFAMPPGMGERDGVGAVQASAPGTRKDLRLPGAKAPRKAPARRAPAKRAPARKAAGKKKR